ncbi:CsgG/HfaB family protein [Candidatus Marinimicrobia bacterium]|nr:CsgG/HfaB family protein [Candidatus Neomarinimicrobiota bacterium]
MKIFFLSLLMPLFISSQNLGRIAVSSIEGPNRFYSRNFSNKLEKELSSAGFEVVERGDVNQLMEEWKLQSSGLTDGDNVEFSGISNADYLIVGTFNGINDYYGIFATIQMVNIVDGSVISTASVDGQISKKNELYTIGIESLVEQLVDESNSKMEAYIDKKNKETLRLQKHAEKLEKEEEKRIVKKQRSKFFWRFIIGTIELLVNILEIFNTSEEEQ